MKSSLRLQLVFFVLVAALLVRVAMAIPAKARVEVAPICSVRTPASSIQPPQSPSR